MASELPFHFGELSEQGCDSPEPELLNARSFIARVYGMVGKLPIKPVR